MNSDFKVYIADGKEFFVFKKGDRPTKTVKPFSYSLLDLLYLDIDGYEQILREMASAIPKLYTTKDDTLAQKVTDQLHSLAKSHVFFEYLYNDWSTSLAEVRTQNYSTVVELLSYKKKFQQMPSILGELRAKLLTLMEQVLDIGCGNQPLQERLHRYMVQKDTEAAIFTFAPQTTYFEAVEKKTFTEVLYPDTLEEIVNFFVRSLLQNEIRFRKCKNCGKYFPLTGYSNAEYCERTFGDSSKTCKEAGALNVWQKKAKNPAYEAYSREYKKRFARIKYGKLSKEEFSQWAEVARVQRERCVNGELELQEYAQWLNS